jgi:hypothetical protein
MAQVISRHSLSVRQKQTSFKKGYISRRYKIELFFKRNNAFENKIPERKKIQENGTGIVGSGCQSSKHQDQSSPTEHSQIIP